MEMYARRSWVGESLLSNAAKGNTQGDLSKQTY